MEETKSTAVERTTGEDENQKTNEMLVMSSKPLHRFVQRQPRSFGVMILMFGCAEVVMGFVMADDNLETSFKLYTTFWQGILFLTSGVLSIYSELHPSKKMVTICLAMYVASLVGITISAGLRIHLFNYYSYMMRYHNYNYVVQVVCVEGILFASSLFVSAFLIFLIVIARFALKSTQSQIIVQHIVMHPQREVTSN
ncbi:uncharacterized protein FYW61_008452 [Anableps anableps]